MYFLMDFNCFKTSLLSIQKLKKKMFAEPLKACVLLVLFQVSIIHTKLEKI